MSRLEHGVRFKLALFSACLSAHSIKFRRARSKAICRLSRVFCANSSVTAVLPTRGIPRMISTGSQGCLPNSKTYGVSCVVALKR